MANTYASDIEATREKDPGYISSSSEPAGSDNYEAYAAENPVNDVYATWYGRLFSPLRRAEKVLDRKLGVEAQGPARVLPNEREKPQYWNMISLWASGTMNLSAFATGFIGSELGLDLKRTIVITIFATLLGGMVTAWCATQGAPTGLRQVSIARYSIG